MSKAYFASEWAGLEHHSLLFRDPTNKERRFIPVLIEDCDPPYTEAQFAYVDWREPSGEAYDKLLKACRPERSKRRQKSGRPRRSQRDPRRRQVVHTAEDRGQGVNSVAVTADGRRAVTGSRDRTLKVWDLEQGTLLATLEGHGDGITAVGVTGDGRRAVSGSFDQTLKGWDLEQGALLATLTDGEEIWSVALTADGQRAVSGASGHTLKIWDLPPHNVVVGPEETTRYTNAKVVLVGESGVGKTGLAMRLAENKWRETSSTHGMTVWPLALSPADDDRGAVMEREVWLWDFAGQPDYRLIHQLYMDETALALMVFDPQKGEAF